MLTCPELASFTRHGILSGKLLMLIVNTPFQILFCCFSMWFSNIYLFEMPLKLVYNGTYYDQNTNLEINKSTFYKISGKTFKSGKYYYELTYYEGTHAFMTGFFARGGYMHLHHVSHSHIHEFTHVVALMKMETSHGTQFLFLLDFLKRILLNWIDIDDSQFYVFSETAYYNFTFPKQAIGAPYLTTRHNFWHNKWYGVN